MIRELSIGSCLVFLFGLSYCTLLKAREKSEDFSRSRMIMPLSRDHGFHLLLVFQAGCNSMRASLLFQPFRTRSLPCCFQTPVTWGSPAGVHSSSAALQGPSLVGYMGLYDNSPTPRRSWVLTLESARTAVKAIAWLYSCFSWYRKQLSVWLVPM